jgi:hypothetical protein
MPRRVIDLWRDPGMLLDIASYARPGQTRRDRLSPQELALLTYTARRTPEVVVKVSGGATSGRGALAHLQYIDRHGRLEIDTDQAVVLQGKEAKDTLVDDWELDLLAAESRSPYRGIPGRKSAKLVHNVVAMLCPARCRSTQREGFVFPVDDGLAASNANNRGISRRSVGLPSRSYRRHAEVLEESRYS